MKKTRVVAMLLAILMLVTLLSGCAEKEAATSAEEGTSAAEPAKEADPVEDPVPLTLVMFGDAGARNTEFFANEFHDRILEDLNIDVTVEYLPWGSTDQLRIKLASGEDFACMHILNLYPDLAADGLLAPIDESKLETLAPKVVESRNGLTTTNCKYQDKLYCIPVGAKAMSEVGGNILVRNDLLKEVGYEASEITTYDQLMEAIAAVKAVHPEIYVGCLEYMSFADVITADNENPWQVGAKGQGLVVDEGDPDSDTVFSWYETEWFEKYAKLNNEWYKLGYIAQEDTNGQYTHEHFIAGAGLLRYGEAIYIYNHNMASMPDGCEVSLIDIDPKPNIMGGFDYDWGWALSAEAADKEEALMKLLNWIYSTEENYNFSLYGVEGTDWTRDENGYISRLTQESFFYDWEFDTPMYKDYSQYDSDEVAKYLAYDEGCVYSKSNGFTFDNSAVEADEALIAAVIQEYFVPIEHGILDYDTYYPQALEKLKEAGIDTYLAEFQRQFSEFMANK